MLVPRSSTFVLTFCFLVGFWLHAQTPPPEPQQARPSDLRLKVSVDQVRVDVIVTDKRGDPVPGLQAEDFEIYQDGELQSITNLVFIEGPREASTDPAPFGETAPDALAPVPTPHIPLERHQVRRAFALVVDDIGLSFDSLTRTRRILIDFIRQQIQPGDMVALARTSQAVGALQQFTSDKHQLETAAKRLRFRVRRSGVDSAIQTARTLYSLLFIINGLKDLPGRKSIILLSDGLSLFAQDVTFDLNTVERVMDDVLSDPEPALDQAPTASARVADAMKRVVDAASRAFVSIYAIDARGLVTAGYSAADRLPSFSASSFSNLLSRRSRNLVDTQSGLAHLAQQTGGLFYHNNNNLQRSIERALEDQGAYYVLSYKPPPEDESVLRSKRPPFRRIEVKVKAPGLKVRHRAGFLALGDSVDVVPGVVDQSDREALRRQELLKIISSPFASDQIEVNLTSSYFHDPDASAQLRVMAHVDGQALDYQEEEQGEQKWLKASVDVLIVLSDLDGQVVMVNDHTFTLSARGRSLQRLKEDGVVFPRSLAIEKPGGYHLKVAVRDQVSGQGGSAAQFVEVPRFRKNQLTLSGLGLVSSSYLQTGLSASQLAYAGLPVEGGGAMQETTLALLASSDGPAVRRFPAGSWLTYSLSIYNPRLDRQTGRPRLNSRMILFREGREVYRGEPRPIDWGQQKDMRHLWLASRLGIPQQSEPGDYVLQVIVQDELAAQEHSVASQWIEFEVLPPVQ